MTADDSSDTGKVPRNDKPADKRRLADSELAAIIKTWPKLPKAIKAGILAMVNAATSMEIALLRASPLYLQMNSSIVLLSQRSPSQRDSI